MTQWVSALHRSDIKERITTAAHDEAKRTQKAASFSENGCGNNRRPPSSGAAAERERSSRNNNEVRLDGGQEGPVVSACIKGTRVTVSCWSRFSYIPIVLLQVVSKDQQHVNASGRVNDNSNLATMDRTFLLC